MNVRPDYYRTEQEAGCDWMLLVQRNRRANLALHWLLAGIGLGMVAFGFAAQTLRMVP